MTNSMTLEEVDGVRSKADLMKIGTEGVSEFVDRLKIAYIAVFGTGKGHPRPCRVNM